MSQTPLSSDGLEQLLHLEEKVQQTIELLRAARADKQRLLQENARLRQELEEHGRQLRSLHERLGRLEKEREAVRSRVQRLLERVDSLTSAQGEA